MCEKAGRLTYSVAEAARALGISRSYCYELVQEGVLPHLELGRRRLIPRTALERYVRERTRRHPGIDSSSRTEATGAAGDGPETLVELAGGLEPPT
jgi:excisionase family DNA binding protein